LPLQIFSGHLEAFPELVAEVQIVDTLAARRAGTDGDKAESGIFRRRFLVLGLVLVNLISGLVAVSCPVVNSCLESILLNRLGQKLRIKPNLVKFKPVFTTLYGLLGHKGLKSKVTKTQVEKYQSDFLGYVS
jgi:hypothetical protein